MDYCIMRKLKPDSFTYSHFKRRCYSAHSLKISWLWFFLFYKYSH